MSMTKSALKAPIPRQSPGPRQNPGADLPTPPRERILTTARELFYRHGIHAVGVDAIAEAAATNKMTLYRHFDSKDLLVAECLRRLAAETDAAWEENAGAHAGDPRGQLLGWVRGLSAWKLDLAERGC